MQGFTNLNSGSRSQPSLHYTQSKENASNFVFPDPTMHHHHQIFTTSACDVNNPLGGNSLFMFINTTHPCNVRTIQQQQYHPQLQQQQLGNTGLQDLNFMNYPVGGGRFIGNEYPRATPNNFNSNRIIESNTSTYINQNVIQIEDDDGSSIPSPYTGPDKNVIDLSGK